MMLREDSRTTHSPALKPDESVAAQHLRKLKEKGS